MKHRGSVFSHAMSVLPDPPKKSATFSPARQPREPTQGPASPENVWADIVTAGVSLLETLGQALAAAGTAPQDAAGRATAPSALITQDAKTGRPCLQLPLPDPETLRRISDVLAALAKGH